MLSLKKRIDRIERVLAPALEQRCLVVIRGVVGPVNLAKSSCKRIRTNGLLTDIVKLDGGREGLTDEQLERFVESFPIEET